MRTMQAFFLHVAFRHSLPIPRTDARRIKGLPLQIEHKAAPIIAPSEISKVCNVFEQH